MENILRKQKFGVEIEFTGITREMAAKAVHQIVGGTISNPASGPYYTRIITDQLNRKWKIMRDSSITPKIKVGTQLSADEYRVEFVTPPLKYSDIETLQSIIRKFKEVGAVPHSSCGIHIHIDGANHNALSLRRMINFMVSRQDIIYEALGVESRKSRWCQPICQNLYTDLKKKKDISNRDAERVWYSEANDNYRDGIDHSHYNSTRYHGLNLHSFFSKGTVEFRLFNSTLHAGRVKAYIQFCLALSTWSIESNDRVVFRSISGYSYTQKVTLMYHILTNRLGLYGDEFKTCRFHLMKRLKQKASEEEAA